jgi:outer membrane protein assembly factor BamB
MKYYFNPFAKACILMMILSTQLQAQNWPQWRGPDANGVAEPGNYPIEFSATDHLIWKSKLPGAGGSTPIVWNDRIILTSGIGEGDEAEDGVLCFDWEGNQVWEVKLGKQIAGKHPRGSGSNPSAITDGERVFVLFKSTTLAALDFDGSILWKTNLQETFGELTYWWDFGTSPVLAEGHVVVAIMHEGQSFLAAFDQSTGALAWKADRNYVCEPESAQSYTTPLVIRDGANTTLAVWGADHLTGHNAVSGERIWSYSGFNPSQKQYWRTIASPAISEGIIVVPYGRGRFMAAVKINRKGDMTEADWLWGKSGFGTDVATPIAINGQVYFVSFNGMVGCLNLLSGEERWQTKLPDVKGLFYSSPTLAGNKLYICSDEGSFYVCEVSSEGITVVSQTQFEDNVVASPVLVQDKLLVRGTRNLYCIGKK